MIQKGPAQFVLGALGDVAGSALFRNALKYWWLSAPVGYAIWASISEHRKRKDLTPMRVVADVAPAVSLIATMVLLNNVLEQRDNARVASVVSPAAGSVKDASFTTSPA